MMECVNLNEFQVIELNVVNQFFFSFTLLTTINDDPGSASNLFPFPTNGVLTEDIDNVRAIKCLFE